MSHGYSRTIQDWVSPVLLRTVWHDRLVFVAAFLVTFAALSLLRARAGTPGQGELFPEPRSVAWQRIAMAAAWTTIAVIGLATVYGFATSHADIGFDTFLAALGGMFGCVLAWKILSRLLPGKSDEQPISILAVVSLCVLLIVLNFPVFRFEFALLLNNLNIASLKVPSVLEIGFGQRSEAARQNTASPNGEQEAATSFQRSSDPSPGLDALTADVGPNGYLTRDEAYIRFLYSDGKPNQSQKDGSILEASLRMIRSTTHLLGPMNALATCLTHYVEEYPDSHLLLIDVKPVIATLFTVHAAAKRSGDTSSGGPLYQRQIATTVGRWSTALDDSFRYQGLFDESAGYLARPTWLGTCIQSEASAQHAAFENSSPDHPYFGQPYIAIALADLLLAYGAPDAGVQILSEWLDGWDRSAGSNGLSPWFRVRAASELAWIIYTITGEANRSYHRVVWKHRKDVEDFLAERGVALDDLKRKCHDSTPKNSSIPMDDRERDLLYLISGIRSDLGRSDVYFFSNVDDFLDVENIYLRAVGLADIDNKCLPDRIGAKKGYPADWRVTIGLVGIAAADRMNTLASSSREHRRVLEVREQAARYLDSGREELESLQAGAAPGEPKRMPAASKYADDIFGKGPWDLSISLAKFASDRLKEISP